MARYEHSIDVTVPLETAYNQWTQFEEFPKFMEGVKSVTQITDTRLHWVAEIAGQEREWDAEISEQKPDARIAWHSISGAKNAGVVTFHYIAPDITRVMLQIDYDPEGFVENVAAALGIVQRRMSGDLERFKSFIEAKGYETGAWRGEVDRMEDMKPIIGGGSRYTDPDVEATAFSGQESAAAGEPVTHMAELGYPRTSSYIRKESDTFNRPTSGTSDTANVSQGMSGAPQDEGYGDTEERGQRNVLGDDTFISSGEGDGTNNGGGGIPTTAPTRGSYGGVAGGMPHADPDAASFMTGAQAMGADTASQNASGSDPRLIGDDQTHGVNPGDEPAHSFGAVEDDGTNDYRDDDGMDNDRTSNW